MLKCIISSLLLLSSVIVVTNKFSQAIRLMYINTDFMSKSLKYTKILMAYLQNVIVEVKEFVNVQVL